MKSFCMCGYAFFFLRFARTVCVNNCHQHTRNVPRCVPFILLAEHNAVATRRGCLVKILCASTRHEEEKSFGLRPGRPCAGVFGNQCDVLWVVGRWRIQVGWRRPCKKNGLIFGIPSYSTSVLVIDPVTRNVTMIGTLGSDGSKWSGGVLAPNGLIFGIPRSSPSVLVIDPDQGNATVSPQWLLSAYYNKF